MGEGGRIVAVTYATGARTGSWQPWVAMGSAKAARGSLCRYFAWALARCGITVNAVSPGATEDSVFSTLPPQVLRTIRGWAEAGWVPMRRLTTPADVGDVVALLCAKGAGFVTGQIIHVDGGASLASSDFPLEFQTGGQCPRVRRTGPGRPSSTRRSPAPRGSSPSCGRRWRSVPPKAVPTRAC